MRISVKPLEWQGPGGRYAYKSSFFTTWSTMRMVDLVQYTIRYKEHNPNPEPGYGSKPFDPYYQLSGTLSGSFTTLEDAKAAAQTDFHDRILAVIATP